MMAFSRCTSWRESSIIEIIDSSDSSDTDIIDSSQKKIIISSSSEESDEECSRQQNHEPEGTKMEACLSCSVVDLTGCHSESNRGFKTGLNCSTAEKRASPELWFNMKNNIIDEGVDDNSNLYIPSSSYESNKRGFPSNVDSESDEKITITDDSRTSSKYCKVVEDEDDTTIEKPDISNLAFSSTLDLTNEHIKHLNNYSVSCNTSKKTSPRKLCLYTENSITDKGDNDDSNFYIPTSSLSAQKNLICENEENDLNSSNMVPLSKNMEHLLAEQSRLQQEISSVKDVLSNKITTFDITDLNLLPDKGLKLKIAIARDKRSLELLNEQLIRVKNKLASFKLKSLNSFNNEKATFSKFASLSPINVDKMGKRELEKLQSEQKLTVQSLELLHKSLKNRPSEETIVSDPEGLKVPLMRHQKQALAWLMWRENEKPSGGILADDMGLGKTLTMISLVLKKVNEYNDTSDKYDEDCLPKFKGGTLVVCPTSLIKQWEYEIKRRLKQGLLSCIVHHGQMRESKARKFAGYDIVITSYSIVRVEFENKKKSLNNVESKSGPLFDVNWQRVILDEAHTIRNHRSKTSAAVFKLKGKYRWALTGTPVHNKTEDFFALVKFLRCEPFNDISVWKKWVETRDETGPIRLKTLTTSLLLRRTKEVLVKEGFLSSLPDRTVRNIEVTLTANEFELYKHVANFSKTLLSELLYQKAAKESLLESGVLDYRKDKTELLRKFDQFTDDPTLKKLLQGVTNKDDVKTHIILVLLLRLRQICCHPALIKSMIQKDDFLQDCVHSADEPSTGLMKDMSSLSVDMGVSRDRNKSVFDTSNPIFNRDWQSSKVRSIIQLLEEDLLKTNDKIVIVSQWSSMLDLLSDLLKKRNVTCESLTGKVHVNDRMCIINNFNDDNSNLKILLLSLTAGGTGLNLIGGNHLILTDIHWNPQLEAQACDRIYRVGQRKSVCIYKFVCSDTIEERIQVLQKSKLAVADNVLTGAQHVETSKLSLQDLKMLFNVK